MRERSSPATPADGWTPYADQRYRYEIVGRHIRPGESVLEIGGGTRGLAQRLTAQWRTQVVTLNRPGANADPMLFGDACCLPFASSIFDSVVLIDVIEHIHAECRDMAVQEARRVARRQVVLTFPYESPENVEAEEAFQSRCKEILGRSKPTFDEHRALGLPTIDWARSHAGEGGIVRFCTSRFLLFRSLNLQLHVKSPGLRRAIAETIDRVNLVLDSGLPMSGSYRILMILPALTRQSGGNSE